VTETVAPRLPAPDLQNLARLSRENQDMPAMSSFTSSHGGPDGEVTYTVLVEVVECEQRAAETVTLAILLGGFLGQDEGHEERSQHGFE
jgi:hypothetical protein